jgi:hypothetical protein
VILRVISTHGLGAAVGSLATVQAIETSRSGDWLKRSISSIRSRPFLFLPTCSGHKSGHTVRPAKALRA